MHVKRPLGDRKKTICNKKLKIGFFLRSALLFLMFKFRIQTVLLILYSLGT